MNFSDYKVIIWGHKLHTHTSSYVHNAFYRTFEHMGFKTFWFDDNDDVSQFDFSKSLFVTEGQVDKKIPLREDCFYVLHNCYDDKYQQLYAKNRCMNLQVYTDDVLGRKVDKIEECIYYDVPAKLLYMPWATDLLPHEIDNNKPQMPFNKNNKMSWWVGTICDGQFGNINQINPFKTACQTNGIIFAQASRDKSVQENIQLIKNSYMAPTIVGEWQHRVGYIPCRIFKNISYGQFGITNSPRIYELFERKIIHNNDTGRLFFDAKQRLNQLDVAELHSLMDYVKEKHTYLNRIGHIFAFIKLALLHEKE